MIHAGPSDLVIIAKPPTTTFRSWLLHNGPSGLREDQRTRRIEGLPPGLTPCLIGLAAIGVAWIWGWHSALSATLLRESSCPTSFRLPKPWRQIKVCRTLLKLIPRP
jgi:hypothetical protein